MSDTTSLTAQKIGVWAVLAAIADRRGLWACRCQCGAIIPIQEERLLRQTPISCGCHLLRFADPRFDMAARREAAKTYKGRRELMANQRRLRNAMSIRRVGILKVLRRIRGHGFTAANPGYACRCACGKIVWRTYYQLASRKVSLNLHGCSRGCFFTQARVGDEYRVEWLLRHGMQNWWYLWRRRRGETDDEILEYWQMLKSDPTRPIPMRTKVHYRDPKPPRRRRRQSR